MKVCSKCGTERSVEEFYHDPRLRSGRRSDCNICCRARALKRRHLNVEMFRAQSIQWAKRNPEKMKAINRKSRYGISGDQFQKLLAIQSGVCAICKQPETNTLRGKVRALSVDHCHQTGRIRGLLCFRCNQVIGTMQDNPTLLRAAAKYLEAGDAG